MHPFILTNPRTEENRPFAMMDADDTLVSVSREASHVQAQSLEMAIQSALRDAETEDEARHILHEANALLDQHVKSCILLDFAERNTTTDNPNTIAYPSATVDTAGMLRGIAELWIDGSGRN